jgi:hypothetical protein
MTEVDYMLAGGGLLAGAIACIFLFGGKNPGMSHKRQFQLNSRTRMASKLRRKIRGKRTSRSEK